MPERKREVAELRMLFEISKKLDASLDIRAVLEPVLECMAKYLDMMRGTITLLNPATGEITIAVAYGLSESQRRRGRYRMGEGVTGKVVQTAKPAVVPRISEEPLFLDRTGARKSLKKEDISFVCVPIVVGSEVVGTLSADRLFDHSVALTEDMRLMQIIASMIAQAVRLRQAVELERNRLKEENTRLEAQLKDRLRPERLIGNSSALHFVIDMVEQVSRSNATVIIRGESGTGKELIAHAIHSFSHRATKPYVKVNLAALPETVIESELFGHEKGAFTGAVGQRKGRFELADGGTIFLDEIGYISLPMQAKLLRILQEKEFERVGGTGTLKCDVRVITATNKNLEQMMEAGTFLPDLYYRLNVFPIHVPPLRERRSDILTLADHFVEKYGKLHHKKVKRISTSAIDMLMSYHWPGNVRELENCIERAVLVSSDEVIHGHHLPPTLQTAEASGTINTGLLEESLGNLEREMLCDSLKTTRGNRAKASKLLGITERQMGLRVEKHGIDCRKFKGR